MKLRSITIALAVSAWTVSAQAHDPSMIKHGIKASGMPAWGPTHDDQRIWAVVAFLQKLPELTPQQYQVLTARSEEDPGHHH